MKNKSSLLNRLWIRLRKLWHLGMNDVPLHDKDESNN